MANIQIVNLKIESQMIAVDQAEQEGIYGQGDTIYFVPGGSSYVFTDTTDLSKDFFYHVGSEGSSYAGYGGRERGIYAVHLVAH